MAGLTPTGFESKTYEELEQEIDENLRANVASTLALETATPLGQLKKLVAERLASLWDLAKVVWASGDINQATGISLVRLVALTGTTPQSATPTRVLSDVNVDAGTYPAGTLISHVINRPADRFFNVGEVSNPGPGAATIAGVVFEAEVAGPTQVNANELTVIAVAVPGWNTIDNPTTGSTGLPDDTDETLRQRQAAERAASGSTTAPAIAADIRGLTGVLTVRVLKNDTNLTDSDGLPPHSIEPVVLGPEPPTAADDLELANQIAATKADGIQSVGTSSQIVTDSEGNEEVIGFTRPTAVALEASIDLTYDPDTYVGDDAVKASLKAYVDALRSGDDVLYVRALCSLLLDGVTNVNPFTINKQIDPPASVDIPIALREYSTIDPGDIVVNSTPV